MPTDGLNTRTAIPLIELDWRPYEMPKLPSKKKPPEFRRVSQWHSAEWNGQTVFRGVVSVDRGKKRFVFYVPMDFPLHDPETIEEQCQYYDLARNNVGNHTD